MGSQSLSGKTKLFKCATNRRGVFRRGFWKTPKRIFGPQKPRCRLPPSFSSSSSSAVFFGEGLSKVWQLLLNHACFKSPPSFTLPTKLPPFFIFFWTKIGGGGGEKKGVEKRQKKIQKEDDEDDTTKMGAGATTTTSSSSLLLTIGALSAASAACYFACRERTPPPFFSRGANRTKHDKRSIVKHLDLIPHPEGGFFRETHRSGSIPMDSRGKTDSKGDLVKTAVGNRNTMTSIYYLIEDYQGLVRNKSDHVHYHHYGCTVLYHIVNPTTGEYWVERLGTNILKGDKPQVIVPGNYFKAATLEKTREFDFALLGEGVGPGFDFRDFEFVSKEKLKRNLANHSNFYVLERLCKPGIEDTDKFYEKNRKNNRNGSSDELSKGKDAVATTSSLKKIPTPKKSVAKTTNAGENVEQKSPQPPLPPSPPPPNALRTSPSPSPSENNNISDNSTTEKRIMRSMAANHKIRFEDIGQSTPQFKPPKNISRIDRDNIEITPMGLKTKPEDDEGDKSLELESPL